MLSKLVNSTTSSKALKQVKSYKDRGLLNTPAGIATAWRNMKSTYGIDRPTITLESIKAAAAAASTSANPQLHPNGYSRLNGIELQF